MVVVAAWVFTLSLSASPRASRPQRRVAHLVRFVAFWSFDTLKCFPVCDPSLPCATHKSADAVCLVYNTACAQIVDKTSSDNL